MAFCLHQFGCDALRDHAGGEAAGCQYLLALPGQPGHQSSGISAEDHEPIESAGMEEMRDQLFPDRH